MIQKIKKPTPKLSSFRKRVDHLCYSCYNEYFQIFSFVGLYFMRDVSSNKTFEASRPVFASISLRIKMVPEQHFR